MDGIIIHIYLKLMANLIFYLYIKQKHQEMYLEDIQMHIEMEIEDGLQIQMQNYFQ